MEIKIRNAKISDAKKIQEIYAPYVENTSISFEWVAPSVEEMENRIENTINEGFPYLVAEKENEVIGYAYGSKFAEREAYKYCADLSIYLDEKIHSKGVGQKLYNEIEKKLKEMGIIQLVSIIISSNEKSINFHKKNGFEEIGYFEKSGYKFEKWHDTVWMKKIINDFDIVKK